MPPGTQKILRGSVIIPTSKPHTQRALLMAALASGESVIRRPNVCSESMLLQDAAEAFGARVVVTGGNLTVCGVAGRPARPGRVVQVASSGFALRHLLPIAALAEAPCVLGGSRALAARPVRPLLEALAGLGGHAEPADPALVLPVVTWTAGLAGGQVTVPATDTSQFVSALMLAAPYATGPVRIRVPGTLVSRHYVQLTADLMTQFGAQVSTTPDLRTVSVRPGGYHARTILVGPDVTSLFYFIAAAVIADADIVVPNVTLGSDRLLDAAAALGRQLGVRIRQDGTALRITSGPPPASHLVIDALDIPTLVPALAAVASSLPAGMTLHSARHIQHHKTRRLQIVLDELGRMGRILRPRYRSGELDGFATERRGPCLVREVDSRGDHRNFMALWLAAMTVPHRVQVLGAETLDTSFAEFQECFCALAPSPAHS